MIKPYSFALFVVTVVLASSAAAAEQPMMQPRVPADQLAEARALNSPLPAAPEIIEKGNVLYNGKGGCVTCHGADGDGKGPAAAGLNPSPRDFRHHGFWRHRTEGELFWVIKHGSPGTSMIGFRQVLSDEEIWTLIHYERTFAGMHGPGMMEHGEDQGPMMGPGGGMGGMEGMQHRGRRDGQNGMSK